MAIKRKLICIMNTLKGSKVYGFTIVESLLVLLVVSLFIGLPVVYLPRLKARLEVQQFLNQFEKYTLLTQQVSIISNEFTRIARVADREDLLEFSLEYGQKIYLTLPNELSVGTFKGKEFNKGTGNMSQLGNIRFTWAKEKQWIDYTFLFGKGHYEKTIKPIK